MCFILYSRKENDSAKRLCITLSNTRCDTELNINYYSQFGVPLKAAKNR